MILSDREIRASLERGDLIIDPFDERFVRPSSVCLRLGRVVTELSWQGVVDVKREETYPQAMNLGPLGEMGYELAPRQLVLGATLEKVGVSRRLGGFVVGLSGLGRLGLGVSLADLVSPGYGWARASCLTLELYHVGDAPLRVYPGMRICHLVIFRLGEEASVGYDEAVGIHGGEFRPQTSRFFRYFT